MSNRLCHKLSLKSKLNAMILLLSSIWEALGGNTRDLDSTLKETGQDYNFTRSVSRIRIQCLETASKFLMTPSKPTSDGVRSCVTASGLWRRYPFNIASCDGCAR
ncbi:hypothetical protein Tco_0712600 [Tanacetum coccineum]